MHVKAFGKMPSSVQMWKVKDLTSELPPNAVNDVRLCCF